MVLHDKSPHTGAWAGWRRTAVLPDELLPSDPSRGNADEFRLLADNMPALCSMLRGDGTIVWLSRRWRDYCGIEDTALEDWRWDSIHHPDQLPMVEAIWALSIEGGKAFELTFPIKGRDGQFRPFLTRMTPLKDSSGSIARWYGIITEITGQSAALAALHESEARLRVLTDAMPQMVWSTRPDGYHDYFNAQWYGFTGVPVGSTDGEEWRGLFHPDDQARTQARWQHSLVTGEPYEIEYRLRHRDGSYRWTLGRALPVRDATGTITRWIGTCTDIDAAKRAAEANELLGRELSHRIKNIFAVVAGLIAFSARRFPEAKVFAQDLRERVAALGRAHEVTRPQRLDHAEDATLHALLRELLKPYEGVSAGRLRLTGADVPMAARSATPVALVFHELATNAMKYGALGVETGRVDINVEQDGDMLLIRWTESGGPPLGGPPAAMGFGTTLAALGVEQQLGGSIQRFWHREGLAVELRLPAASLAALG
jgi:PAS domain S-box-containing protein